jgi:hypothetical protein
MNITINGKVFTVSTEAELLALCAKHAPKVQRAA